MAAATSDRAIVKDKTIEGCAVQLIDISGTYHAPPFAGGGRKENYRVLIAVIDAKGLGVFYVKFNGPAGTVDAHKDAFHSMIDGLQKSGDRNTNR